MKCVWPLVVVASAWLALSCGSDAEPEDLPWMALPDGAGRILERSLRVRVGHGMLLELARTVESVAVRGTEGVATVSAGENRVWVVGLVPGATELEVLGKNDILARLRVSVEPPAAPVANRATPAVLEVDAGPHATARWTFERGRGSVLRTGFDLKRVYIADPEVVDFVVSAALDVQLIAKKTGTTNLLLASEDEVELFAELGVVDPDQVQAEPTEHAGATLPTAGASRWAAAATELDSGEIRRIESPYTLKRVAVSDPCIADFDVVSQKGIALEAHDAGYTRLFAWDERGVRSVLDVQVTGRPAESAADFLSAIRSDDCNVRNQVGRCRRDPASSACLALGREVRDGTVAAEDAGIAARLFEQACQHDHGEACADLAGLELAAARSARAAELLDQACAAERSTDPADGELCELAQALRACAGGDAAACTKLGDAFDDEGTLGKNVELERSYHEQACQRGDGQGCLALGYSYFEVETEEKRVSERMQRACELDIGDGCAHLGYRLMWGRGEVAQDLPRARQVLERGCALKSASACRRLSAHYGQGEHEDEARSFAFALQGCELDDGMCCEWAASFYQSGDGVERDNARARELYAKACSLGEKSACRRGEPRRGLITRWIERWLR